MMTRKQLERTSVATVAASAFASGAVTLFAPLIERIPLHIGILLTQFHPVLLHRALSTLMGFSLIYLSYQLAQRKRTAWWAALLISVYLVIVTALYHGAAVVIVVAAINLVCLALGRSQFTSRSRLPSLRQGILLLVLSLLLALVYGVVGFWVLDRRDFNVEFSVNQAIDRTLEEYTLIGNEDLHPHTRYAKGFLDSLDLIGIVGLAFGLVSLFRPLQYTFQVLPHEREEVARLLGRYGDSSEGFLKLWPNDKSYFFSADRRAVIAYKVNGGVALSVGGPAGEAKSRGVAVMQFKLFCQENGWDPAFILVPTAGLDAFEDWRRLKAGEDGVVGLQTFESTAHNKHFRNIRNRFIKQDYTFASYQPPHSQVLIAELAAVSAAWLASGKKQWGFMQGHFDPVYLRIGPLHVVRDASGRAVAFANGVPTYVEGQATFDMMRHLPDAPSNTMDYLLMETLLAAKKAGYQTFNLGLAPLSSSDTNEPTPEERMTQLIARLNQNFISVEGLYRFKQKFEPDWDSQYVIYGGLPTQLIKIAVALARATRL